MKRTVMVLFLGILLQSVICWGAEGDISAMNKEANAQLVKYYKTGDLTAFDASVLAYSKILEVDAENDNAMIMLANLYIRRTNQLTDILAAKEFKNKQSHFALANIYLAQNRYQEAQKHYEICIEKFPKWACPLRHKGEALLRSGKSADAIPVLQKCLEVRKDHFDAYVFLAKALVAEKRYPEAEKVVDQAVECLKKTKACSHDGELEAFPEDCTKLYIEIYENLKDYKKVKFYKEKLEKK